MLAIITAPLRWLAVIAQHRTDRIEAIAAAERAFADAVNACRAMPSDDTDHITIARQRNVFD